MTHQASVSERIATIAGALRVTHSTGSIDGWERWTLGDNPDSTDHFTYSPTHVIRGPSCLVITGDMGDMIFERSGGIALGFAHHGLHYVAEKCRAGECWAYDSDKASKDLLAFLQEMVYEDNADGNPDGAEHWRTKSLEADDIDFEDERGVWQWYHDNVSCDDVPDLGRVPSDLLFRVLGCIEAVRSYASNLTR